MPHLVVFKQYKKKKKNEIAILKGLAEEYHRE